MSEVSLVTLAIDILYRVGRNFRYDPFLRPLQNNFRQFRSVSIISMAQATFRCILSHFSPKLGTFRATDVYLITVLCVPDVTGVLALPSKICLSVGQFWSKMTQNILKSSLGNGEGIKRT